MRVAWPSTPVGGITPPKPVIVITNLKITVVTAQARQSQCRDRVCPPRATGPRMGSVLRHHGRPRPHLACGGIPYPTQQIEAMNALYPEATAYSFSGTISDQLVTLTHSVQNSGWTRHCGGVPRCPGRQQGILIGGRHNDSDRHSIVRSTSTCT